MICTQCKLSKQVTLSVKNVRKESNKHVWLSSALLLFKTKRWVRKNKTHTHTQTHKEKTYSTKQVLECVTEPYWMIHKQLLVCSCYVKERVSALCWYKILIRHHPRSAILEQLKGLLFSDSILDQLWGEKICLTAHIPFNCRSQCLAQRSSPLPKV